ncbi:MAG: murein L,D-transpeptidase catalytic domain family protein [Sphingobacteriales bacterium]|nr:murein L,D-transpeptidase catalytic domain family protein [Sphingobacteriales bacterium]
MKRLNKKLRTVHLFVNSVIIFLLHIPFVFAKSAANKIKNGPAENSPVVTAVSTTTGTDNNFSSAIFKHMNVFDSLHLNLNGLSKNIFDMAVKGLEKLKESGVTISDNIISIIDFSQPSCNKRLYIIDLNNYSLLFNTYVAHGQNSGKEYAEHFSNRPKSLQSSPGFYLTMDTYLGNNGYSLKLNGLEQGINNNALRRDIVVHGAAYVNESLINEQGYIGRSWGCPAIPLNLHRQIIETIKNGTCLFIYAGQSSYLNRSSLVK